MSGALAPGGRHVPRPVGYFSFQPPIVPLTFTIRTDGSFSVDVGREIVTPLGDVRFVSGVAEHLATSKPVPIESVGVTQLFICRAGSGQQRCRGYEIRTGRKVTITLNGRFEQTIENGRVTINAYPGSTVKVTDAGAPVAKGPRPAARIDVEDFNFSATSPYTEVDLEQSQRGRQDDLYYDHVSGVLGLMNGASVADIQHYVAARNIWHEPGLPKLNLPDENNCARTKPSAWQRSLTAADLRADITVSCLITAERDFGYLVIGRDPAAKPISYFVYSYIWVR